MREADFLEKAVLSAAEILSDSCGEIRTKTNPSGIYDAVTDADLRIEESLVSAIRGEFPDDAILSEETSPESSSEGRCWILDPVDGTVNMSRGIPLFGIQGTFAENGVPKASVIYLPCEKGLYAASPGGAFLGGKPLRTAPPRPLRECILSTGDFSRKFPEYRRMQADLLSKCRDDVGRFRMLGAACTDFAYLASGRTDIHLRFVNRPWDYLPGMHIAEKAGAVYDESLLKETGILMMCSSPEVLEEATEKIMPVLVGSSAFRRS